MSDKQYLSQTEKSLRELDEGKDRIADFFRDKLTRMTYFHEKYFKKSGKPSLRTVQRVIYERAKDNYDIWEKATTYFFAELAKERRLAQKIKKAKNQ